MSLHCHYLQLTVVQLAMPTLRIHTETRFRIGYLRTVSKLATLAETASQTNATTSAHCWRAQWPRSNPTTGFSTQTSARLKVGPAGR